MLERGVGVAGVGVTVSVIVPGRLVHPLASVSVTEYVPAPVEAMPEINVF